MSDLHFTIKEEDQPTHPKVLCDSKTGTCSIEGLSFMENSRKFYQPILDWIYNYVKSNDTPFKLFIKISYLNSSTSKIFFDLFTTLKDFEMQGKIITAEWHFAYYDEEIEEDIDDMISESGFDILKLPYSK